MSGASYQPPPFTLDDGLSASQYAVEVKAARSDANNHACENNNLEQAQTTFEELCDFETTESRILDESLGIGDGNNAQNSARSLGSENVNTHFSPELQNQQPQYSHNSGLDEIVRPRIGKKLSENAQRAWSQDSNGDIDDYDDCYETQSNSQPMVEHRDDARAGSLARDHVRLVSVDEGEKYDVRNDLNGFSQADENADDRVCVDQLFDENAFGQSSLRRDDIKDSGYGDIHDGEKNANLDKHNVDLMNEVRHVKNSVSPSSLKDLKEEKFVDCYGDDEFLPAREEMFHSDAAWAMLNAMGGNGTEVKLPVDYRPSVFVRFDPLYQRQVVDDLIQAPEPVTQGPTEARDPRDESTESVPDQDLIQILTPTKKQTTAHSIKHPAARKLEQLAQGDNVDNLLMMNLSENMKKSVTDYASVGPQDIIEVLKYSQLDMNRIKKEMELKWNACLLAKTKEWDKRDAALQMQNAELKKSQGDMKNLLQEYERTMSEILAERERATVMSQDASHERDQAAEDLHSMEVTFSVLHRRFEKTKATILSQKENEDALKEGIATAQSKLKSSNDYCNSIIRQAEEKLDEASTMIDNVKKSSAAEVAHLEAALKKRNVEFQTLDKNHERKVAENKELVAICDELIEKMGNKSGIIDDS